MTCYLKLDQCTLKCFIVFLLMMILLNWKRFKHCTVHWSSLRQQVKASFLILLLVYFIVRHCQGIEFYGSDYLWRNRNIKKEKYRIHKAKNFNRAKFWPASHGLPTPGLKACSFTQCLTIRFYHTNHFKPLFYPTH